MFGGNGSLFEWMRVELIESFIQFSISLLGIWNLESDWVHGEFELPGCTVYSTCHGYAPLPSCLSVKCGKEFSEKASPGFGSMAKEINLFGTLYSISQDLYSRTVAALGTPDDIQMYQSLLGSLSLVVVASLAVALAQDVAAPRKGYLQATVERSPTLPLGVRVTLFNPGKEELALLKWHEPAPSGKLFHENFFSFHRTLSAVDFQGYRVRFNQWSIPLPLRLPLPLASLQKAKRKGFATRGLQPTCSHPPLCLDYLGQSFAPAVRVQGRLHFLSCRREPHL